MPSTEQGESTSYTYLSKDGINGNGTTSTDTTYFYIDNQITNINRSNELLPIDGYVDTRYVAKTYFVMRGIDVDCLPAFPVTYVTWIVSGTPDLTGLYYTGTKCGVSPLSNITIINKFTG